MTRAWEGRPDDAGRWPTRKPIWSMLLFVAVFTGGLAVTAYRYTTVLPPLQRIYFGRYVYSWPGATFGLSKPVAHTLLMDRTTQRLATDGIPPERVVAVRSRHTHADLFEMLRMQIYHGRTPTQVLMDVARPAAWAALALFVLGLFITAPLDRGRIRSLRNGQPVRGRQRVDAETFNRLTPADGLRIRQGAGVKRQW
jgi:hypothetical protein